MTTHTPKATVNHAGYNGRFPCGCKVTRAPHDGLDLLYCPTHAQAPAMLAALQNAHAILELSDPDDEPRLVREMRAWLRDAQPMLRAVEG